MHAELLSVRDLSVSFVTEGGVARVLDAVSLSLASGEIMGLVGESGCGKTTLARAILGALPANANVRGGALLFDGREEAVEVDVKVGEAVGMDDSGHGFKWSYYIRFLFAFNYAANDRM